MPKLVNLALTSVLVTVVVMLWYAAAVWWAPMDTLTMLLPQRVRDQVSQDLITKAELGATGLPLARRALRLNPASESALVHLCAAGVSEGSDIKGAIKACEQVASMTNSSFHAYVIAKAYEEAQRPCDGLPILKKTMGEERRNNTSPILEVARLEVTCGEVENAERHLRVVVKLRQEALLSENWKDRPPGVDGKSADTYEKVFRLQLSEARQNLSALLTLRGKSMEAFQVCQAALGAELKRCACRFTPREGVQCDSSQAD